jgi:hypothetical protein
LKVIIEVVRRIDCRDEEEKLEKRQEPELKQKS